VDKEKLKLEATRWADGAEKIIFESRWTLAPLYAGLLIAMVVYFFKFVEILFHMVVHMYSTETEQVMLDLLGLVDITMVGNLVYMVMVGGYSIFVREIDFHEMKNKPRFLNNINSGTLKVKLAMSLVGVSAVHLLKDFMNAEHQSWSLVGMRLSIHCVFILSALGLAWTDKMLHPVGESHKTEGTSETDHAKEHKVEEHKEHV